MSPTLTNRHFLRLLDFTPEEIHHLLALAKELKTATYAGQNNPLLAGKKIVLLFEKTSTRTRCAFETAACDLGAFVTFLAAADSQMGEKESIPDTARTLGRMYDAIEYRGFHQTTAQTLAQYAGVPVWNGLTNEYHPTQVLADFLTMQEHCDKPLHEIRFAYLGDARYNMGNSLLTGAAQMGMTYHSIAPENLQPTHDVQKQAQEIAARTGASLTCTDNIAQGVKDCDFVYTDVWVSMGEPQEVWQERIEQLLPFQVNRQVLEMTGNPAVKFMHCLPAFHNKDTALGEKIYQQFGLDAMEVTDEVFESAASVVFDEAENRVHTIKAVMVATLT